MTLGIVARCAVTGHLGAALVGDVVGIGQYTDVIRSGVGAVLVQGRFDSALVHLGLNLLEQGLAPRAVLDELLLQEDASQRQMAVIDAAGGCAVHCGAGCRGASSVLKGEGWAVLGENLGNDASARAVAQAFAAASGALDERLMTALEAARSTEAPARAGHEGSAAVILYGSARGCAAQLFLRNDLAPDPVGELRLIFDEYKAVEPLYAMRVSDPSAALTPAQIDAAAKLAAARKAAAA